MLVVLSLLVLFAMIAVTFMLVAGQYRRMSRAAGKAELVGNDPQRQLDEAFGQVVRDTQNPQSSLYGHSLLADLHGTDGLKLQYGTTNPMVAPPSFTPAPVAGGQFIDLTFNPTPAAPGTAAMTTPVGGTLSAGQLTQTQTAGYYNGCVLTAIGGSHRGSARIVGWGYDGTSTYTIRVMASEGVTLASLTASPLPTGVLVNGRPFNGTGFGLNPAANPTTDATLLNAEKQFGAGPTNIPFALLPNARFFVSNSGDTPPGTYTQFGGMGGADEDYDAADPQNMLLAYVPIGPLPTTPPGPGNPSPILPSLHRPDLINYIANHPTYKTVLQDSTPTAGPQLLRQIMLRPVGGSTLINTKPITGPPYNYSITPPNITVDHPNFTGSNPTFDAVLGPWDVDNDGDGVAESVWVDIGLPVQTAPDGRRYKPLVAILCTDLDGRLNVNAHGTFAQAQTPTPSNAYNTIPATGGTPLPAGTTPAGNIGNYIWTNTGSSTTVSLPRGQGYGPPEVNLGALYSQVAPITVDAIFPTQGNYLNFLAGMSTPSTTYEGRYGDFGTPLPMPGRIGTGTYPYPGPDDILDEVAHYDIPPAYNYYSWAATTTFGSPCDFSGRSVLGIDYAGQPIWSYYRLPGNPGDVLGTADQEAPHNPYAVNLSRRRVRSSVAGVTWDDNVFTPAELERVLRRYDLDAGALPERLQYLLNPTGANPADLARLVTTESFDLPSPAFVPTRDMLLGQDGLVDDATTTTGLDMGISKALGFTPGSVASNLTLVDLLKYRMVQNSLTPTAALIAQLLPPEVIAGQRFDLNRPFGNGVDDAPQNGVVDEPGESEPNGFWTNTAIFGTIVSQYSNGQDLNNDGIVDPSDSMLARQQYARYLYVMMMLFVDNKYLWSNDPLVSGNLALQQELTARRIAQWAVNVVDFRDPDSIMTPFEYDVNPFNSFGIDWAFNSSDDITATDRRLVWGAEAPELLLTETLALHDRRVKDLASAGPGKMGIANPNTDTTMDQYRIPEGSLFLELYCPHNGNKSVQALASQDVFTNPGNQPVINLGALAPASGGVQYPVWQVAITKSSTSSTANEVHNRLMANIDVGNFDPQNPGMTFDQLHGSVFDPNNARGQLLPERYIWFSSVPPSASVPYQQFIYYNAGTNPTALSPGQYAVVGPRATTYIGANNPVETAPSQQSIVLTPAAGTVTFTPSNATAPNNAATTYPALPIICTSNVVPAGFSAAVGVSVSEPLPTAYYTTPPTSPGPIPGTNDVLASPIDTPFDVMITAEGVSSTGTHPNYKTALLQRLANPLIPYDPVLNPYVTVDWMAIDLTTFNGDDTAPGGLPDPADPTWTSPPPAALPQAGIQGVGSRERGSATLIFPTYSNLWGNLPQQSTNALVGTVNSVPIQYGGGSNAIFDYNLNQSLGYLNKSMGAQPWRNNASPAPPTTMIPTYLGYQNAADPTQPGFTPFSWFTWNNRPYVSNMELLQVPPYSAEEMLRKFTTAPTGIFTPYDASGALPPPGFSLPFRHLFNFFLSTDTAGSGKAPYFYRLLDFVHVPSRFVGTETILPPAQFAGALPSMATEQALESFYHPPFNRVSNYRDPGRVNINTIAGIAGVSPPLLNGTWAAILNGGPGPTWPELVASRRGNRVTGANITSPSGDFYLDVNGSGTYDPGDTLTLDINGNGNFDPPTVPALFANPFRSAAGGSYRLPGTFPLIAGKMPNEVDVTLMRPSDIQAAPTDLAPTTPVLRQNPATITANTPSGIIHPYFFYQNYSRTSNLLTTRSNVYAVWITMGYFEVTPAPAPINYTIYPDGYQLGAELGSDSGEIKRHRAFYIYDRTIPVGFEPGRNHNIDDGTLVKRFIE